MWANPNTIVTKRISSARSLFKGLPWMIYHVKRWILIYFFLFWFCQILFPVNYYYSITILLTFEGTGSTASYKIMFSLSLRIAYTVFLSKKTQMYIYNLHDNKLTTEPMQLPMLHLSADNVQSVYKKWHKSHNFLGSVSSTVRRCMTHQWRISTQYNMISYAHNVSSYV